MIHLILKMKYKNFIFFIIAILIGCSQSNIDGDILEVRKSKMNSALKSEVPILQLYDSEDGELFDAQEIVVNSAQMEDFYFHKDLGGKMLNEVFMVSSLRPSEAGRLASQCKSGKCFRVDIFNFALNGSIVAVVDMSIKTIIDFQFYAGMQPNIPEHLAEIAFELAQRDIEVRTHLGCIPTPDMARMVATKTALNKTRCQRSEHLCVAPTFVHGNKALWTIVDLTDLKVVGVKWTEVGSTAGAITERSLENEIMMSCFCEQENEHQQGDWKFKFKLTRSDGMEIYDITYKNEPFLESVKLVDWHVSYSQTEGFGYSDAIGCPEFSQAAVIAVDPPVFENVVENGDTVGFALIQDYFSQGWPTPCSYNYQQQFVFYNDGGFRPKLGSLGRGCGTDGIYRPVTRISFAKEDLIFQNRTHAGWENQMNEAWFRENESYPYDKGSIMGRLLNEYGDTILMEANRGQFSDGSKGDNAYVYLTLNKEAEGVHDLPTIGPCCNTDHQQGPDKFINSPPESLLNGSIVVWYVPEIHNDGRPGHEYCWSESVIENGKKVAKVYPCFSGPKFNIL